MAQHQIRTPAPATALQNMQKLKAEIEQLKQELAAVMAAMKEENK